MNQITINNVVIEIFVGDLINAQYDAIVIPTNSRLLPSGTLRCKVIKEAGHAIGIMFVSDDFLFISLPC